MSQNLQQIGTASALVYSNSILLEHSVAFKRVTIRGAYENKWFMFDYCTVQSNPYIQ